MSSAETLPVNQLLKDVEKNYPTCHCEKDPASRCDPEFRCEPERQSDPESQRDVECWHDPERQSDIECRCDPECQRDVECWCDPERQSDIECRRGPENEQNVERQGGPENEQDVERQGGPENEQDVESLCEREVAQSEAGNSPDYVAVADLPDNTSRPASPTTGPSVPVNVNVSVEVESSFDSNLFMQQVKQQITEAMDKVMVCQLQAVEFHRQCLQSDQQVLRELQQADQSGICTSPAAPGSTLCEAHLPEEENEAAANRTTPVVEDGSQEKQNKSEEGETTQTESWKSVQRSQDRGQKASHAEVDTVAFKECPPFELSFVTLAQDENCPMTLTVPSFEQENTNDTLFDSSLLKFNKTQNSHADSGSSECSECEICGDEVIPLKTLPGPQDKGWCSHLKFDNAIQKRTESTLSKSSDEQVCPDQLKLTLSAASKKTLGNFRHHQNDDLSVAKVLKRRHQGKYRYRAKRTVTSIDHQTLPTLLPSGMHDWVWDWILGYSIRHQDPTLMGKFRQNGSKSRSRICPGCFIMEHVPCVDDGLSADNDTGMCRCQNPETSSTATVNQTVGAKTDERPLFSEGRKDFLTKLPNVRVVYVVRPAGDELRFTFALTPANTAHITNSCQHKQYCPTKQCSFNTNYQTETPKCQSLYSVYCDHVKHPVHTIDQYISPKGDTQAISPFSLSHQYPKSFQSVEEILSAHRQKPSEWFPCLPKSKGDFSADNSEDRYQAETSSEKDPAKCHREFDPCPNLTPSLATVLTSIASDKSADLCVADVETEPVSCPQNIHVKKRRQRTGNWDHRNVKVIYGNDTDIPLKIQSRNALDPLSLENGQTVDEEHREQLEREDGAEQMKVVFDPDIDPRDTFRIYGSERINDLLLSLEESKRFFKLLYNLTATDIPSKLTNKLTHTSTKFTSLNVNVEPLMSLEQNPEIYNSELMCASTDTNKVQPFYCDHLLMLMEEDDSDENNIPLEGFQVQQNTNNKFAEETWSQSMTDGGTVQAMDILLQGDDGYNEKSTGTPGRFRNIEKDLAFLVPFWEPQNPVAFIEDILLEVLQKTFDVIEGISAADLEEIDSYVHLNDKCLLYSQMNMCHSVPAHLCRGSENDTSISTNECFLSSLSCRNMSFIEKTTACDKGQQQHRTCMLDSHIFQTGETVSYETFPKLPHLKFIDSTHMTDGGRGKGELEFESRDASPKYSGSELCKSLLSTEGGKTDMISQTPESQHLKYVNCSEIPVTDKFKANSYQGLELPLLNTEFGVHSSKNTQDVLHQTKSSSAANSACCPHIPSGTGTGSSHESTPNLTFRHPYSMSGTDLSFVNKTRKSKIKQAMDGTVLINEIDPQNSVPVSDIDNLDTGTSDVRGLSETSFDLLKPVTGDGIHAAGQTLHMLEHGLQKQSPHSTTVNKTLPAQKHHQTPCTEVHTLKVSALNKESPQPMQFPSSHSYTDTKGISSFGFSDLIVTVEQPLHNSVLEVGLDHQVCNKDAVSMSKTGEMQVLFQQDGGLMDTTGQNLGRNILDKTVYPVTDGKVPMNVLSSCSESSVSSSLTMRQKSFHTWSSITLSDAPKSSISKPFRKASDFKRALVFFTTLFKLQPDTHLSVARCICLVMLKAFHIETVNRISDRNSVLLSLPLDSRAEELAWYDWKTESDWNPEERSLYNEPIDYLLAFEPTLAPLNETLSYTETKGSESNTNSSARTNSPTTCEDSEQSCEPAPVHLTPESMGMKIDSSVGNSVCGSNQTLAPSGHKATECDGFQCSSLEEHKPVPAPVSIDKKYNKRNPSEKRTSQSSSQLSYNLHLFDESTVFPDFQCLPRSKSTFVVEGDSVKNMKFPRSLSSQWENLFCSSLRENENRNQDVPSSSLTPDSFQCYTDWLGTDDSLSTQSSCTITKSRSILSVSSGHCCLDTRSDVDVGLSSSDDLGPEEENMRREREFSELEDFVSLEKSFQEEDLQQSNADQFTQIGYDNGMQNSLSAQSLWPLDSIPEEDEEPNLQDSMEDPAGVGTEAFNAKQFSHDATAMNYRKNTDFGLEFYNFDNVRSSLPKVTVTRDMSKKTSTVVLERDRTPQICESRNSTVGRKQDQRQFPSASCKSALKHPTLSSPNNTETADEINAVSDGHTLKSTLTSSGSIQPIGMSSPLTDCVTEWLGKTDTCCDQPTSLVSHDKRADLVPDTVSMSENSLLDTGFESGDRSWVSASTLGASSISFCAVKECPKQLSDSTLKGGVSVLDEHMLTLPPCTEVDSLLQSAANNASCPKVSCGFCAGFSNDVPKIVNVRDDKETVSGACKETAGKLDDSLNSFPVQTLSSASHREVSRDYVCKTDLSHCKQLKTLGTARISEKVSMPGSMLLKTESETLSVRENPPPVHCENENAQEEATGSTRPGTKIPSFKDISAVAPVSNKKSPVPSLGASDTLSMSPVQKKVLFIDSGERSATGQCTQTTASVKSRLCRPVPTVKALTPGRWNKCPISDESVATGYVVKKKSLIPRRKVIHADVAQTKEIKDADTFSEKHKEKNATTRSISKTAKTDTSLSKLSSPTNMSTSVSVSSKLLVDQNNKKTRPPNKHQPELRKCSLKKIDTKRSANQPEIENSAVKISNVVSSECQTETKKYGMRRFNPEKSECISRTRKSTVRTSAVEKSDLERPEHCSKIRKPPFKKIDVQRSKCQSKTWKPAVRKSSTERSEDTKQQSVTSRSMDRCTTQTSRGQTHITPSQSVKLVNPNPSRSINKKDCVENTKKYHGVCEEVKQPNKVLKTAPESKTVQTAIPKLVQKTRPNSFYAERPDGISVKSLQSPPNGPSFITTSSSGEVKLTSKAERFQMKEARAKKGCDVEVCKENNMFEDSDFSLSSSDRSVDDEHFWSNCKQIYLKSVDSNVTESQHKEHERENCLYHNNKNNGSDQPQKKENWSWSDELMESFSKEDTSSVSSQSSSSCSKLYTNTMILHKMLLALIRDGVNYDTSSRSSIDFLHRHVDDGQGGKFKHLCAVHEDAQKTGLKTAKEYGLYKSKSETSAADSSQMAVIFNGQNSESKDCCHLDISRPADSACASSALSDKYKNCNGDANCDPHCETHANGPLLSSRVATELSTPSSNYVSKQNCKAHSEQHCKVLQSKKYKDRNGSPVCQKDKPSRSTPYGLPTKHRQTHETQSPEKRSICNTYLKDSGSCHGKTEKEKHGTIPCGFLPQFFATHRGYLAFRHINDRVKRSDC